MTLKALHDALISVSDNVFHFSVPARTQIPYIVYAEDADTALWADDQRAMLVAIQGTIDLYCKSNMYRLIRDIPRVLSDSEISFYLNSIQTEDETGLMHYEWVFEVFDDGNN